MFDTHNQLKLQPIVATVYSYKTIVGTIDQFLIVDCVENLFNAQLNPFSEIFSEIS